jgi:hypothetical protein
VIETEDTYQGIEFGIFNFKHLQIVISFNTWFKLADEEGKGEEGLNYEAKKGQKKLERKESKKASSAKNSGEFNVRKLREQ